MIFLFLTVIDHIIRVTFLVVGLISFYLQNYLCSLWRRFNKLLHTHLRDYGPYWREGQYIFRFTGCTSKFWISCSSKSQRCCTGLRSGDWRLSDAVWWFEGSPEEMQHLSVNLEEPELPQEVKTALSLIEDCFIAESPVLSVIQVTTERFMLLSNLHFFSHDGNSVCPNPVVSEIHNHLLRFVRSQGETAVSAPCHKVDHMLMVHYSAG